MAVKESNKDNELLVEFDFLVDLDLALFRLIQDKYSNSSYVNKKIISMKNEYRIINMLLFRKCTNPLEVIMPDIDTKKIYNQFCNDNEEELLKYATPYDTLYLMVTYLNQASSVGITILCKNQIEVDYIKAQNSNLQTIICEDKSKINLDKYSALYIKYITDIKQYGDVAGKYIYIASAQYNFDENNNVNPVMVLLYGDVNIIKLMDLYTKVKFYIDRKGEDEDDLFEYSSGEQGEGDTEGDSWYNSKFS